MNPSHVTVQRGTTADIGHIDLFWNNNTSRYEANIVGFGWVANAGIAQAVGNQWNRYDVNQGIVTKT